jgi:hypothetical protein
MTFKFKHAAFCIFSILSLNAIAQETEKKDIAKDTTKVQLQEVFVQGKKKLYEQKVDRLVFNVENSINASNGDAIDVLKITPSVKVGNDDQISLVGKQGVRVMINGRLLNITGEDLVNYLKTIQSKDIEKVEVITAPGAQYDAEGNSGLINIKLKGVRQDNFSGSVNGTYSQAVYASGRGGVNLNYKKDKWTVATNLNYTDNLNYNESSLAQKNLDNDDYVNTDINQKVNYKNLSTGLNLDYDFNKKNSIGMKYWGSFSKANINVPTETSYGEITKEEIKTQKGTIEQFLSVPIKQNSHSLNLHYIKELNDNGGKITTDWDYFSYFNNKEQNSTSMEFDENHAPVPSTNDNPNPYDNKSNGLQNIHVYTGKVDVEMPLDFAKLAYGGKISFIHNVSDNQFYNVTDGNAELDKPKSNVFTYNENTQALYFNISKSIKKFDIQLGYRAEFTQRNGESVSQGMATNPNFQPYFKSFPSVFITYKASEIHVFNFSYNKRISRPSYWNLDPFTFYTKTLVQGGNPSLLPAFTNNISFKHTYKSKFTTEISAYKTTDQFGQISRPDTENQLTIIKQDNFYDRYGINLSETFTIKPKTYWESSNQVRAYYGKSKMYHSLLQEKYGVDIDDIDGFGGNFSTNNTFTLNEAKTFTFLVNFNQELFGTDGYSYDKPNANLSLGLRYLAFNKKLDFNLKGNDVFNQGIYKSYSTVNNIREDVTWRSFGRSIALTVRYNFGSDKVKIKQHQEGNNEEKQRAGGN